MKLFVLVRGDLSKSQQAVQAGHALAELLLRGNRGGWDNGTIVYLKVKDLKMLEHWFYLLGDAARAFYEPDIGDQMTALAFVGCGMLELDRLPLV